MLDKNYKINAHCFWLGGKDVLSRYIWCWLFKSIGLLLGGFWVVFLLLCKKSPLPSLFFVSTQESRVTLDFLYRISLPCNCNKRQLVLTEQFLALWFSENFNISLLFIDVVQLVTVRPIPMPTHQFPDLGGYFLKIYFQRYIQKLYFYIYSEGVYSKGYISNFTFYLNNLNEHLKVLKLQRALIFHPPISLHKMFCREKITHMSH